jgi:hypothetical protein
VGQLRILDVPTNYQPNQQYDIRVQLTHAWDPLPADPVKWGFEITAVQATTGDSAVLWIFGANAPPDTFKSQKPGSGSFVRRRYISHTRNVVHPIWPGGSTRMGEPGPTIEWTLKWQAPPGDSGKIYLFAAGNSSNGDGVSFSSNDFVFTTSESMTAGGNVSVPRSPRLTLAYELDAPYPNPMEKCTNIDFTLVRGGVIDLAIYDLQGRRVRTLLHEFRNAGTHGWSWDGRRDGGTFLANGVYFLRLRAAGEKHVLTRKIALARN